MSNSWIKEVASDAVVEGEYYFIATRHTAANGQPHYQLASRGLNGKEIWSIKPGIAVQYIGGEQLKRFVADKGFVLLAVPKDADTRWRRRKHKRFSR